MPIVTATIKSDGKVLPAIYELLSIVVSREVGRIPWAELVLVDGDPAKRKFALSDEPFFEPGKQVEIQLRYEGTKGTSNTVFKGLVVGHNLAASAVDSTLTVTLKDSAIAMTRSRNSRVFEQKSDADIFKELISDNLKAGTIPPTQPKHKEIVQYYCSDWDFMLSRAEVNNLLVLVEDGEVSLAKTEVKGQPKHTFEFGISEIFDFEMEADASRQYTSIESVAWDVKKQALTQKSKATKSANSLGNLEGGNIATKLGGEAYLLSSTVSIDPNELKAWADGAMARNRLALIRGVVTVPGIEKIKLMDMIKIAGVGERFNGQTIVTGFRHTVDQEGWQTQVQFGLSDAPFTSQHHIQDAPAAGLLPAVQGLQIGVVAEFKDDDEFRVRVVLPGVDPERGEVWARLASPDAGKNRGYFFRPETGDEVVIGFLNDDPRQAIILGALFSSTNAPPQGWEKLDAKNAIKGLVSKSGFTLEFDDEKKTFTCLTPEKQSILLDDENKTIEIKDANDNIITLNDKGFTIKSNGDLNFEGKNITLNASANVQIKGSKVDVK